jgi:hypothetical protein
VRIYRPGLRDSSPCQREAAPGGAAGRVPTPTERRLLALLEAARPIRFQPGGRMPEVHRYERSVMVGRFIAVAALMAAFLVFAGTRSPQVRTAAVRRGSRVRAVRPSPSALRGLISTTNGFARVAVNVYAGSPGTPSLANGNSHAVSQYDVAVLPRQQLRTLSERGPWARSGPTALPLERRAPMMGSHVRREPVVALETPHRARDPVRHCGRRVTDRRRASCCSARQFPRRLRRG